MNLWGEKLTLFWQRHQVKIWIVGVYALLLFGILFVPKIAQTSPSKQKSLNVILFPESVAIEVIRAFTDATGIQVNVKNVEADAEVQTYLTDKDSFYDLACVPDYLATELAAANKLLELDTTQIPNYAHVHSLFQQPQKPLLSIPFVWTLFGIGVDNNAIKIPTKPSWSLLFDPANRVCVSDDPRHLVTLAAMYLHKPLSGLSDNNLAIIMDTLQKQKQHVEIYTDTNIALLFANSVVPLAFCSFKTIEIVSEFYPHVSFVLPAEGGIKCSQDWVILNNTKNAAAAHAFINFLTSREIAHLNEENTEFLPTNGELLANYWKNEHQKTSHCPLPPLEAIKRAKHPCDNISAQKISDLWITLKSS